MKLYRLHNALSRTLGDPVTCTAGLFQDGVRYSTRLRSQYMAQSMDDIILKAIKDVAPLPHKAQSEVLERIFPSLVVTDSGGFPKDLPDMAFLLSAFYTNGDGEKVSLPIIKSANAMFVAHNRATTIQPSDPYIMYVGTQFLPFGNEQNFDSSTVDYTFIKRPPTSEWLESESNGNEEVEFEQFWMGQVIERSALYAQLDSGELGTASQAVPILHQQQVQ